MQNRIFIGYNLDIIKYFRIQTLQIKQVIIASEFYINELEQKAKLLVKQPLSIMTTTAKRKALVREPKTRKKL